MEADTVVLMITIVGSVLGSTLATIGLSLSQLNRLHNPPPPKPTGDLWGWPGPLGRNPVQFLDPHNMSHICCEMSYL